MPYLVTSIGSVNFTNPISKPCAQLLTPRCLPLSLLLLTNQLLDNNPDNSGEIEDELASISSAMNLIHLTQAIYFQPNPSAIMAEDLMHWVNRLDSKPDPAEGDEIMRKQLACHHPAYWPFLFK